MAYFLSAARFVQKWAVEIAVAAVVIITGGVLYQYFSNFDGVKSSSQEVWGSSGILLGVR